jgi:hypothetical protein
MYVRGIKGFGFGITCCELKICDKGATLKGHGLRVGLPRQGGINHCRLTNFRGLMNNAECSPVIGWGNHTFEWSQSKSSGYGILPANHRAVVCVDHQTTEYRQTTG